jgi:hypothetical protein
MIPSVPVKISKPKPILQLLLFLNNNFQTFKCIPFWLASNLSFEYCQPQFFFYRVQVTIIKKCINLKLILSGACKHYKNYKHVLALKHLQDLHNSLWLQMRKWEEILSVRQIMLAYWSCAETQVKVVCHNMGAGWQFWDNYNQ